MNSPIQMSDQRKPGHTLPVWVKVFGVVALIVVAIVAATHLVGGGMGHFAHGGMAQDASPAEHGAHRLSP
jgi:hypothetical protein